MEVVSAAKQDGLSVRYVERLNELVLEKFPEALRCALLGEPRQRFHRRTSEARAGTD